MRHKSNLVGLGRSLEIVQIGALIDGDRARNGLYDAAGTRFGHIQTILVLILGVWIYKVVKNRLFGFSLHFGI